MCAIWNRNHYNHHHHTVFRPCQQSLRPVHCAALSFINMFSGLPLATCQLMIWLGLVWCGIVGFGMAQWGEHWFATRYFLPSKNLWALPVVGFSGEHLPAAIGSSALFYLFKFLPFLKVPPAASLRGGHPWNCNCCRTHEHFSPASSYYEKCPLLPWSASGSPSSPHHMIIVPKWRWGISHISFLARWFYCRGGEFSI